MRKIFSVVCLFLAIGVIPTSQAPAQTFQSGYQFGAGLGVSGIGGGFCDPFFGPIGNFRSFPREQPPYFAQFPPVYYSHIVRRPYGVSPFAAPPGIMPVEMTIPVAVTPPQSIRNPHFHGQPITPMEDMPAPAESIMPTPLPPTSTEPTPSDSQSEVDGEGEAQPQDELKENTTFNQWQKNPFYSARLLSDNR